MGFKSETNVTHFLTDPTPLLNSCDDFAVLNSEYRDCVQFWNPYTYANEKEMNIIFTICKEQKKLGYTPISQINLLFGLRNNGDWRRVACLLNRNKISRVRMLLHAPFISFVSLGHMIYRELITANHRPPRILKKSMKTTTNQYIDRYSRQI